MRISSIAERFQHWANWKNAADPSSSHNGELHERPLRDELFSNQQLQSHARVARGDTPDDDSQEP